MRGPYAEQACSRIYRNEKANGRPCKGQPIGVSMETVKEPTIRLGWEPTRLDGNVAQQALEPNPEYATREGFAKGTFQ